MPVKKYNQLDIRSTGSVSLMAKMTLYRSPDYQTFESIGLLVHEKLNINFQDGRRLGFPIRMILATFDLHVTSILPMNFESIDLLVQEKQFKIDFLNMAARATILDFRSE